MMKPRNNDRRRVHWQKESRQVDSGDEVETLCEAVRDEQCAVHCYLLHEHDELYRPKTATSELRFGTEVAKEEDEKQQKWVWGEEKEEQKEDEMKGNEDSEEEGATVKAPLSMNYGESVLEWLSFEDSPQFETLREELVHNDDSTLDRNLLDRLTIQCAVAIQGTDYTLKEALGLKTYADLTAFQSELRKAHWKGRPIEIKRAYFHWALTLYEAHLYHSKPIPSVSDTVKNPRRLFHGLNRMFTVNHELPVYLGPFSVSTSDKVARQFSDQQGLLFSIVSSYLNPFKFCVGIDMITFSCFKNEAEILFINQPLPVAKTEIFGDDMLEMVNHLLGSLKTRETRILDKDAFFRKLGIKSKWDASTWMPEIVQNPLLFAKSECDGMNVVDRLVIELSVVDHRLVNRLRNEKYKDTSYLNHLVQDLNVEELYDSYQLSMGNVPAIDAHRMFN